MDNTPDWFWYVGMAAAIVLTALFAHLYFKNPAIIPSAKSGLLFGLTAAAFSFLLDLILFSAGNAGGANVDLGEYYGDYRFWIIVVFVILTATIVGANKKTKTHEPSI
ncbi:MAG TPA: hypothetical protein VEC17_01860, partial [Candidatus Binatia bacterium]|nr:hypothetical protein [Candidatus Binatia bacterium]